MWPWKGACQVPGCPLLWCDGSPAAAGTPCSLLPCRPSSLLSLATLVLPLLCCLLCVLLGQGLFPFVGFPFFSLPHFSLSSFLQLSLLISLSLFFCPCPPPTILTVTSRAACSPSSGRFPVPWQLSKQQPPPLPILSTTERPLCGRHRSHQPVDRLRQYRDGNGTELFWPDSFFLKYT